ncbi:hypothetical protein WA588_003161 [Blastocystis sp. NMH]
MSLDLSQYTQPLEIALDQKKQVLTVPYICNSMIVTPTTAKLILRKIAEKKGNSVVVTVCVMGIRNGTYTVLLCNSDRLQDVEKQFSLVTSVHHYSVSPKTDQPIADGISNSIFQALDTSDSDPASRSHIVNPSIKVDAKSVRAFSTPTMQTHSSPSTPTKILHSGASQSSVKSLFAKAPQKAKAKVKKEIPSTRDHSTTDSTHDTPNDPTNDDDLFDKEASDDDEISRQNRIRQMQLYAEHEDADTQPIPAVESEPEEAASPESKSKKRNEPVSGAMDLFAKKVAVEPKKENGKKRVKKVREVTGEDGFSYFEEYYEEVPSGDEESTQSVDTKSTHSTSEPSTQSVDLQPTQLVKEHSAEEKKLSAKTTAAKTTEKKSTGKKQASIASFFSRK